MNKLKRLVDIGAARMWQWGALSILSIALIAYLYPQQIGPMIVKLSIGSLGAYLGYWIDRTAFHVRPHEASDAFAKSPTQAVAIAFLAVTLRRAIIIVGMGMVAALGL